MVRPNDPGPGQVPSGQLDPTAVQGAVAPPRRRAPSSGRPIKAVEPRIAARDLGRRGPISAFSRLARTHLLSVAGDALFTIGLATTVFFNSDPNAPRTDVLLYLMLTLAPFAIASPFIGPLIDRAAGGRRWVIFASALARALIAFLLVRDYTTFWLYIEAFLMLVFSKVHLISKSALLPTTVRNDDELVEANSKLSLLGALAAVVAGGPGLAASKLFGDAGPSVVLVLAGVVFVAAAVQAFALPDVRVAPEPLGAAEKEELRGAGIRHALSAMAIVRFTVGFLTFLIAFSFRSDVETPLWWYLVVALTAQAGFLSGAGLAPLLRRKLVEEQMLMVAMGATVLAAIASIVLDDLASAALISFAIGMTSSIAKQGFDALVQRDAPDANRGRSFAKFEARFQLVWVVGALFPVALPILLDYGYLFIALVVGYGLVAYLVQFRRVQEVLQGRRDELPQRDPHWRRLLDVLRERRRSGSSGVSGVANGGAFDTTTVWSDEAPSAPPARPPIAADDATVALDEALRGPGLLGEPDVPVPTALVEAPDDGLFSPDGRALTPPLHPVEPGAILADPVPIAGPDLGEVTVVEAPPQPEAPAITDAPALPDAPARPDAPEPEQTMSGQAVVTGWQTAEPQWGQAPPGADDGSAPAQPRLPGFDDTGQHR
ncbi:MAG: MFS transporter [Acidimicrobiales bacterium]